MYIKTNKNAFNIIFLSTDAYHPYWLFIFRDIRFHLCTSVMRDQYLLPGKLVEIDDICLYFRRQVFASPFTFYFFQV